MCTRPEQRGISLIELIIFIVVVGVALAGILRVMNVTGKSSADPMVYKQALAIAQALLEEVELMPFTFCDPDDPAAALVTTISTAQCAQIDNPGPEAAFGAQANDETRYGPSFFDHVNDYNGCQMNTGVINTCDTTGTAGIRDIANNPIGPAAGYRAAIAVVPTGLAMGLPAANDALLITVTVTSPNAQTLVLEGVRTRYAPRDVP